MNFRVFSIILYILLLLFQNLSFSQSDEENIAIAVKKKIFSNVLNEERQIFVALPGNYANTNKQYPVFFLLDGSINSISEIGGLIRYYSPQRMPEMIVVGIPNTDRMRDFSRSTIFGYPKAKPDGSDNFLKFLSQELIPFIDKNYRTTNYRVFYGGSATGAFVVYSLLTKPELFNAFLASSPGLGSDKDDLLPLAEKFFSSQRSLDKFFYIYYGKTDGLTCTRKIPQLASIIKKYNPEDFKWNIKAVEGRHVPPESIEELIKMLFKGWKEITNPIITPYEGEILSGNSVSINISSSDPVHYTLDGGEPTRISPIYTNPISISKTTTIKAKAIRGNYGESNIISAQFSEIQANHPSVKIQDLKNGLRYKYYDEATYRAFDTITIPPARTGIISNIDPLICKNERYLVEFEGYIKIPSKGLYTIYLLSTSPPRIFFDDKLVLTKPWSFLLGETATTFPLEEGFHKIRIVHINYYNPNRLLKLSWEYPGIKKQIIPGGFYHD